MMRLKSKLLSLNANKTDKDKAKVYSPRNCEELRIPFKTDKVAKVVGKLASIPPPGHLTSPEGSEAELVAGVIVQNDFKMSLMDPEDLREYAGLTTSTIACRQRLTLSAAGIDLIKWALESTFGTIEELPETKFKKTSDSSDTTNGKDETTDVDEEVAHVVAAYLVMGCVTVRYRSNGEVELEWEGNMLNDGIADAVMAVLLSTESSPAAVKSRSFMVIHNIRWLIKQIGSASKHSHSHSHGHELPLRNPHASLTPQERLERLFLFLEAQFGADAVTPVATPKLPPLARDKKPRKIGGDDGADSDASMELSDDEEEEERLLELRQKTELERLHKIGIPVPGITIAVDKMIATVWLEDLEVECSQKVLADRVKAIVERAVEVTAPLWA